MNSSENQIDYSDLWTECLAQIYSEIPEQEFNLWFKRLKYSEAENNTIIVSVESNFIRDQIIARYQKLISKKLQELTNTSISIVIESVSPNKEPHQKGSPPPKLPKVPHPSTLSVPATKSAKLPSHPSLMQKYTFENFVIGSNNRFAANAALAIAKNPGVSYNPCALYSGVGLGKTHLLQSIGNSIYQEFPNLHVIYVTMETFMNEFIQSIREKQQTKFKNKYRSTDVLLIDDIHFLQKKTETQEEMFHTFNALYDLNKQMVFTCDRPISELKNLTSRLKSRFTRGLTIDLQPPDFETRLAILNKKIEMYNISIPTESLTLICENITSNVRDLEAALTRIVAYSELVNKAITVEITQNQLKDFFESSTVPRNISINVIQKIVADYFGVTAQELKGKRKPNTIVIPRQVAMYLSRELSEYSTTEIGLEFGGRDHTTVIHSCEKIKARIKSDPYFLDQLNKLKKQIIETSISMRDI